MLIANSIFGYNKTALLAESGELDINKAEFSHNTEGMSLLTDAKAKVGDIVMKDNQVDVTTESDLVISKVDIPEKESYEILRSFRGPVEVVRVKPFNKSLRLLKQDSGDDLIVKIADSLIEEKYEDSLKLIEVLKELFPDKYSKSKSVEGYALFKTGKQKEGKELIMSAEEAYAPKIAEALGLTDQSGTPAKLRFVKVRIPVIGKGEGIGKIAVSKAVKQSVKDHVKSITGKLPRKKSFIVKGKILSDSDKYSTGAYPVGTRVTGSKFEGLYLVFLNVNLVLADLQDLRIIGNKKRELRIGIASCGSGDLVRPELAKELNTLLFPVVELPSKGCAHSGYAKDIAMNKIDILVIVKETSDTSKSRVSQNLKMISADMSIVTFDAKTGMQLHDTSKGVVVYHMNESMGTKAAMKQTFDSVGQSVLDKLVEIERKRAPAPAPVAEVPKKKRPQKTAKQEAKKQKAEKSQPAAPAKKAVESDKGIILSVAGVEPVFANMPDAFINRPFMTLVIENESSENIRKSELTLDVPGYFPSPIAAELESIPALERVRLQLFAEFTDALKKVNKTKRTDAVITITYGKKKTQIKYPVVIFDAHTTRWNTGEKIGLYLDAEDPGIVEISKGVSSEADKLTTDKQLTKLYKGLVAFSYLNGFGINFTPDAKRPFATVYGSNTKVDTAKYPAELLAAKSGDSDDLLITLGSILKGADVDMAFAVVDGKTMAMFDTSIPEELMEKLGFEKEQIVIYDENIWLPLDITMVSDGVMKAWESGAKIASTLGENSKLIVLSKAVKKYKPVKLFRQGKKFIPVSTFQSKYDELKSKFK